MHKHYYELTITLDSDLVEFVADFIGTLSSDGIELGRGEIVVRSESDVTFIQEALTKLATELGEGVTLSSHIEQKENVDWIKQYQDSIEPILAGKFYIFPSWYPPKEDAINIKIDPALAFGSGHHATTFSCLEAVSRYVTPSHHVVDVGCGSGILGLACCKLGATVDLCDTDPLSVESCEQNFILNQEQYHKLWEGSIHQATHTYDVVIANIIADVLKFIAKDLKKSAKEGGILILSGILDTKEKKVTEAFKELTLIEKIVKDEWVTLVYKKETNG